MRSRISCLIVALSLVACGGSSGGKKKKPQPLADPAVQGIYLAGRMDETIYDANQGGKAIDARIYYPADLPGGSGAPVADGGPYPVLVWGHATVITIASFSHDGYSYLAEHLATWGIIVIAPDMDGNLNATNDALDMSACLDYLEAENTNLVSPFLDRIETRKLSAGGHGRGGEAAIHVWSTHPRVVAVATVAANNSAIDIDCPSITIGGENDIFEPFSDQDSIYTSAAKPKVLIQVLGGDHSQFHDDAFALFPPIPGAPDISRGLQHEITRTYVTAFSAIYLLGQKGYKAYLFGDNAQQDARIIFWGAK